MTLPQRKPTRLAGYDYSAPGGYFITICTAGRRKTLSRITVGAIHESPVVELTAWGKAVDEVIARLPQRFGVEVNKYVIMPNHVHLLIVVDEACAQRAIRESPLRNRALIPQVVGYLKMNASKAINQHAPAEQAVWQRSYHDHVIRDRADWEKIWLYIDQNPARWPQDCFYCP